MAKSATRAGSTRRTSPNPSPPELNHPARSGHCQVSPSLYILPVLRRDSDLTRLSQQQLCRQHCDKGRDAGRRVSLRPTSYRRAIVSTSLTRRSPSSPSGSSPIRYQASSTARSKCRSSWAADRSQSGGVTCFASQACSKRRHSTRRRSSWALEFGGLHGAVRPPVPPGFSNTGHGRGLSLFLGTLGRAVEEEADSLLDQAASRDRPGEAGTVQPVDLVIEPDQQGRVDPQRDRSAVRDKGLLRDCYP